MRYGFTTGSCAAAASKAAAYMLLTGQEKKIIRIETPKGIPFEATIEHIARSEHSVSCAVLKDGGDDPDITTGAFIYAKVSLLEQKAVEEENQTDALILIDGGIGVGRVTKRGLDQPVGNAAINHVPREMIEKEIREVCQLTDYKGGLSIEISVPKGEELSKKTFNPKLGIVGGISILGTSGIVEPMSSQALIDTIRVELNVRRAEGTSLVAVSPGNYGLEYMKETYAYDLERSVKCSNFIGDTIDMAVEAGFQSMLLTGHIGKLIKLSGGIMNTHSKEGDCRMELMATAGILAGINSKCAREILNAPTTEEGLRLLQEAGKFKQTMEIIMEKACFYLNRRAAGKIQIECIIYSNEYGELAKSTKAMELLDQILEEKELGR